MPESTVHFDPDGDLRLLIGDYVIDDSDEDPCQVELEAIVCLKTLSQATPVS